ncbi:MAG TPA: DNA-processing protein DprA [Actinophytocola sp.]|uniref:DNA-processing protein DprA n=1 Tax=Actinophytocola sp. TaxID=1872138 RepID=UPI002DB9C2E7|nr:DNA-processing protein DprA [Actinophytocola sp.]HEU5470347.1 DNA-processing protein DprA [Actinophytocola sp.]
MTAQDDCRRARAYLLRVAEPPAPGLTALIGSCGPVEAAARVRAGEAPERVLHETSARRSADHVDADLANAERVGARLVVPEDPEWPAWQLLALDAAAARGLHWACPPIALWVRGTASLSDLVDRAVSVVGARAATGYGEHVAAEFGHGLAGAGWTIVSGAAYGIDGAAHRGALAAGGRTVAVLGCGVDVGYPAGHASLLDKITDRGLVISEYAPGTPPARHRFLVRNRLIAALSGGTVVVEAGVRSGARNTAASAGALGKELMAVPGPITSAMSLGCHELLRSGAAIPVGSVEEILESVGRMGEGLQPRAAAPARPTDGLGAEAMRVHDALGRRSGRSPDRIALDSGVPLDRVRALLPELELGGLARRCEDGWRTAAAS